MFELSSTIDTYVGVGMWYDNGLIAVGRSLFDDGACDLGKHQGGTEERELLKNCRPFKGLSLWPS